MQKSSKFGVSKTALQEVESQNIAIEQNCDITIFEFMVMEGTAAWNDHKKYTKEKAEFQRKTK